MNTIGNADVAVSCIMPTRNRRAFVRQALTSYRNQTFENAELIVIDDGDDSVQDLCASIPRVRHIRMTAPASTGKKLNIGMEAARGYVVQKLDDDDYYAPSFLETSVTALTSDQTVAERSIVFWDCFLILLSGSPGLRFSRHGWSAGGTLCFCRQPGTRYFRDVSGNEDAFFLRDHPLRPVPVCAPELYVLVRHGANTWRDEAGSVDRWLRQLPLYPKTLVDVVGRNNLDFYDRIVRGQMQ